ncbi:MAG: hypothetical protein KGL94_01740 [Acidobacteriota bacterium]|nr:hypothetical protein [Acidobacteriota bacterium]
MSAGRLIRSRAPLAVGALIAVPLYFATLMATSLALDKPHVVRGHPGPSSTGTELAIYSAALIAPAILLAAGAAGMVVRRVGVALPAIAGIVCCLVLPGISRGWIARHERRFPLGVDFIADNNASNLSNRGEWEHAAQATVSSMCHWTTGLAVGAIVVAVLLEIRRYRGSDAIVVGPPPDTTGGAPQIT